MICSFSNALRCRIGLSSVFFLLSLLLALVATESYAQNVRVYTSTDSVTVGDRFQLHIAADYPQGIRAGLPNFSQGDTTIGDLAIIKQVGFSQQSTNGSVHTDSVTYEVATFALDTARVPPISVSFVQGGDTVRAASDSFLIKVGSLVPEDADDIRPLAPLATFPRPLWPWIAGGLALLLLLGTLLYLYYRRRQPEKSPSAPAAPSVPPYTEAVTRLEKLQNMNLDNPETLKPFFVELSDLLRTYIARVSDVPARELTSRELVDLLARRNGSQDALFTPNRIRRIDITLHLSDLVKFAGQTPTASDSRAALKATRKTVKQLEEKRVEIQKQKEEQEQQNAQKNNEKTPKPQQDKP